MSELIRRALARTYSSDRDPLASLEESFGSWQEERLLARRLDVDDDIDRRIVEGYRRHPPENMWGDASARALIEAEPW